MHKTFKSFINELVDNIYYIPARYKIRKELTDHMIQKRKDLYEILTWEEATEKVIIEMGTINELSNEFNQLYSPVEHYIKLFLNLVIISIIVIYGSFFIDQLSKSVSKERYYNTVDIINIDETYYVDNRKINFTRVILMDEQTILEYEVDDNRLLNMSTYSFLKPGVYTFMEIEHVFVDGNEVELSETWDAKSGYRNSVVEYTVFETSYNIVLSGQQDNIDVLFAKNDRSLEVNFSWEIGG